MPRPTKRLRFRPHAPVNATRYGAAAHTGAALRPLSAVRWYLWADHMVPAVHPRRGRRRGPWPLAGDCAICGWRFGRLGDFARCGGREFRAVRGATGGAAPWTPAILGCPPFVGKSGRRGILRQAKVWLCSHTGCMARSHTAGMAEKARRAPQTHGRWAALTRKKSSKTFYQLLFFSKPYLISHSFWDKST